MQQAGLFPSFDLLLLYSRLHPSYGLHQILVVHLPLSPLSALSINNCAINNCLFVFRNHHTTTDVLFLPLKCGRKFLFLFFFFFGNLCNCHLVYNMNG